MNKKTRREIASVNAAGPHHKWGEWEEDKRTKGKVAARKCVKGGEGCGAVQRKEPGPKGGSLLSYSCDGKKTWSPEKPACQDG